MPLRSDTMQRATRQRQVILEEVRKSTDHPTADEIYERVRSRLPRVSLGTVYRNLDVLAANGEIIKLTPGRAQMRFDGNLAEHYHMICVHCGRITDLSLPPSENIVEILEHMTDQLTKYGVFGHQLEFIGVCPGCRAKGLNFPGVETEESGGQDRKRQGPWDGKRQEGEAGRLLR